MAGGVKLQLVGLPELRAALLKLPQELTDEAAAIVDAHARIAQGEVSAAYPIRSTGLNPTARRKSPWFPPGNLKSRVNVTSNTGRRFQAVAIVKSAAPHAWLYEYGTKNRKHKNGKGVGAMPPASEAQQAVPKYIRIRRRMMVALIALVRRAGFEVPDA